MIMTPWVVIAYRDDCVPVNHVASSIRARDLNLVHTLIRSFPLSAIGFARPQFDMMRVDDPIVPGGQRLIATYRKTARWLAAAIRGCVIADKHFDKLPPAGPQCIRSSSNMVEVGRGPT